MLVVPSPEAARSLLGALLVREDETGRRVGRIVETEAYAGPEDLASHARFTSRARNAVMSGRPGIAYVYLVYGMYDCLNVVTGPPGRASAVLIRAVEPLEGVATMRDSRRRVGRRRRERSYPDGRCRHATSRPVPDRHLARGPGLVGACFGVDRSWTGTDLCDPASVLRLEADPRADDRPFAVTEGPRVGVRYAGLEWAGRPWRFAIDGHPSVSRAR